MNFNSSTIAAFVLGSTFLSGAPTAVSGNCDQAIDVSIFRATGPNAASIEGTFNSFSAALGGSNNGNGSDNGSPFTDGFRRINWDAPIVPFDFPASFFEDVVQRGLSVSSASNQFFVSNDGSGDNRFDSINAEAAANFEVFSPDRLFALSAVNEFRISFSVPELGTIPAGVSGFGAIFVDVDKSATTEIVFRDIAGCILASEFVDPSPGGLSFLGVIVNEGGPIVAVNIDAGDIAIDNVESAGFFSFFVSIFRFFASLLGFSSDDIVVFDDFIYGEPTEIVA